MADLGESTEEIINQDPKEVSSISLGQYGLQRNSGYITEDYIPQLNGKQGAETFTKIGNDEVAGAVLFAVQMLIRQANWHIQAASETPEDEARAQFVTECFEDMERPWSETLTEILSMLQYGWSWHEIIYKIRGGPNSTDRRFVSAFSDNKVGWSRFAIRGQDSLLKWEYSDIDTDHLIAMTQIPAPSYQQRTIPKWKSLLFRPSAHKNNPEGRSVFRHAYEAWYYKRNLKKIEAIGVERDLAGLPIMKLPPQFFGTNANPDEKAALEQAKKIVRNLRRDEQEGLVIPSYFDKSGNDLYKIELLSTGGSKQIDTDKIINRYDQRIAMSVLADFVLLGHEGVGSYSLADSKTSIFTMAIGAWLNAVTDVINREAIPMLFRMNDQPLDNLPKMVYGDIEKVDIGKLAASIQTLTNAGMPLFPDEGLEEHIRDMAGLPQRTAVSELDEDPSEDPRNPPDPDEQNEDGKPASEE